MNKIAIFLFLFFIGTVGIFTFRPLGATNDLLEQSMYCLAAFIATTSAFLALRTYGKGPRFRSLLCLTLGLLCWFIADVTFIYFDFIVRNLPYPSIADCFYLIAYLLLAIGLIFEVFLSDVSWKKMDKKVYLISGLFTAIMLTTFSFLTVSSSYSPTVSFWENVVTIGYTVGDLILSLAGFFILVIAWEYRGGKVSKVWISIFLGFLITMIADLIYAKFTDEFAKHIGLIYSLSQYCYILGYLFIANGFLLLRSVLQSFQKRATIKSTT